MRSIIALMFWLLVGPALAHQEGEAVEAAIFDCEHLPGAAMAAVPPAIAGFARLECSHRGQFLMAGDDWTWRFPGSFFDLPSISAYVPRASQALAEPRYFRSAQVRELDADARERLHKRFKQEVVTYKAPEVPTKTLQLTFVNDAGHDFEVFMPFENKDKVWVITCVPDCPPEYAFMMERL